LKPFNHFNIDKHISVLYVEDQVDIQEEFVDILSLYVDEIHVASNGKEGVQKFQNTFPDIIITDIQMPEMTGLEMIEKIRETGHETPVIVTSAYEDSKYLLEAINMGVEHYLLKPVMLNKLEDHLERIKKRLMQKRELEAYQLYLEERVEEEVALREVKEALLIEQNKSYEIGQMVGIIAHQWKQPLHYLNLLIEDLGMEYEYQPLSKEYIQDFIQKGTDKVKFLSETMDNFLNFYRSEANTQTFSISKVTKEIAMFLDMSFKSSGITIEIKLKDDFSLHGIKNEFQQVILNIINNAKEAFDGQKRSDALITVEIGTEGNEGLIMIQDNAGGISDEILENIFELEYTTKQGGNGLGLYLVKKIVTQRFKGSIEASNSDLGARFTLIFDLNKE